MTHLGLGKPLNSKGEKDLPFIFVQTDQKTVLCHLKAFRTITNG